MSIVSSSVKTIFGHKYIWKWFQPLLLPVTVHWQVMENRECEIFLRLFLFDLFQTLIYRRNKSVFGFMELSQEKPFTLISDNVQIAARQQWNGKSPQTKKNGLEVKIWGGKLLKIQSLIMPLLSLHQLIVH